jgi:hypothetical protein
MLRDFGHFSFLRASGRPQWKLVRYVPVVEGLEARCLLSAYALTERPSRRTFARGVD